LIIFRLFSKPEHVDSTKYKQMFIFPRLILSAVFVSYLCLSAVGQASDPVLELGTAHTRDLKGGEANAYSIEIVADHFVYILTTQRGIDVVVRLIDPEGRKVAEVDGPLGANGAEPLWIVVNRAGRYRVQIEPLKADAALGKYEIKLMESRPATPDDPHFIAAKDAIREGLRLGNPATEEIRVKAISRYTDAARHFWLIENDKSAKAAGFNQVARYFGALKRNDLALTHYDKAIEIYLEQGLKREAMMSLIESRGRVASQLEFIERSESGLRLANEVGDVKAQFGAWMGIGRGYYELGDFSRAIEATNTALSIAKESSDPGMTNAAYDNLGSMQTGRGDLASALEAHQKAIDIQSSTGNKQPQAGTILNIGNVYMGLGNYELAIENFQTALTKFEAAKAPVGVAYALSNIGSAYLEMGQFEKAMEYFERAQPMKAKFLPDDPTSFYNIAAVHKGTGRPAEAISAVDKAIELLTRTGDSSGMANALIIRSDLFLEQEIPDKALADALRAVEISKTFDYPQRLWSAQMSAANAHLRLGNIKEARSALEESISSVERLRSQIVGDESSGVRFFEKKSSPYRMLLDLLIKTGETGRAIDLEERTKARALLDVLGTEKGRIFRSMTVKEREIETKLRNELESLNTQIAMETDTLKTQHIRGQLDKKRLDLEDFRTRLYAAHPDLKVRRGDFKPIGYSEIASLVSDPKTAVLEFAVDSDKVHLLLITKGAAAKAVLNAFTIEVDRQELSDRADAFRTKLAAGDLDFQKASRDLYDLLISPATVHLTGKTDLIIVPDGPLWDLPFQVLMDGKGKYFVENAAVSYAPSLTALYEMKKRTAKRASAAGVELLAFGNPIVGKETSERVKRVYMSERLDPLPEAERLVNELQRMYGADRSKVYTGAQALEKVAKEEAPKFRIVQFATHGILNNVSPMYSHLVLARDEKDPKEDGLLEAWEMKDLDLKADMVILSACDTARGKISGGEGVVGMTWAMFIAGAPTTVASQWKVESSSTTEFMLEFHRQMLSKQKISKAEALRRASLKLMKMPKYRHPSYWGAWVLVGDGS
jgi:CHAT domain-containing protein/Tfp pilus assembly protein PilF